MPQYTLEESDSSQTEGNAVQGVCWVGDCGFCTVWYHASDYQGRKTNPFDLASEAAETEVQEHLIDTHGIEV